MSATSFRPNRLHALRRALAEGVQAIGRHRRAVGAVGAALMAGFGITAVAVAPLAPDAADLPRRVLVEPVPTPDLTAQLQALAAQELELLRTTVTRPSDSAEALLQRLGVGDAEAATLLRRHAIAARVLAGRGGKRVQARTDSDGRLLELVARYPAERSEQRGSHFTRLTLARRAEGGWDARTEQVALDRQLRLASGTIRSSLFAATDEAGLSDNVAVQLAEIFSADVDFHRELRKGDSFHVVYEVLGADGEPVPWQDGVGRVLAAEFVNAGRRHEAIWFVGPDGRGGYYDGQGRSRRRTFLASPMEFSRVTSGFAGRMHPVLRTWRAHLGVDYAAPTGTPVRSVGDGVVEFAGIQGGYGNLVQVQHGNGHATVYAHLSRIEVKKGERVEQGQRIGAVGATGMATGPHLHFEFRVNGAHQDPLRVARASEPVPLDPAAREAFALAADGLKSQLDLAESTAGTRAGLE